VSTRFEERLERELLDAAHRHARGADASAQGRTRRATVGLRRRRMRRLDAAAGRRSTHSPRPALAAAVACTALVLLAGLAVALAGGDHAPLPAATPIARQLPRQCDRAARAGQVELSTAAVDRRLLDRFAVLRRPQNAADRAFCPAEMGSVVNPGAIRLAGHDADGNPVFLVPTVGIRAPALRQGNTRGATHGPLRWSAHSGRPQLCHTIAYARSRAGGCMPPAGIGQGRYLGSSNGPRRAVFIGIFADGVASTELTFQDGSTRDVAVHGNIASFELRGSRPTPSNSVARYRLLDDGGATILVRDGPDTRTIRPLDFDWSRGRTHTPPVPQRGTASG
jgi:hypothetical protein